MDVETPSNEKNKTEIERLMKKTIAILACLNALTPLVSADPIPQGFSKRTIGFICLPRTNATPIPIGTCFFVSHPGTNGGQFSYLVTAKHVLQNTNGDYFPQVLVRLTRDGDEPRFAVFPLSRFGPYRIFTHRDPSVDLALIPISKNIFDEYRMMMFPSSHIATRQHIEKFNIREGDDMFFMGLFTPFYGNKANIPIVRFGRLSMLTDEKIRISPTEEQHFYLMETSVFGGNSGSPAFFYFSQSRNPGDTALLLAGVVKGYYKNYNPVEFFNSVAAPYANKNTGIAAVTPAFQLHEILFSEELTRDREIALQNEPHPTEETSK